MKGMGACIPSAKLSAADRARIAKEIRDIDAYASPNTIKDGTLALQQCIQVKLNEHRAKNSSLAVALDAQYEVGRGMVGLNTMETEVEQARSQAGPYCHAGAQRVTEQAEILEALRRALADPDQWIDHVLNTERRVTSGTGSLRHSVSPARARDFFIEDARKHVNRCFMTGQAFDPTKPDRYGFVRVLNGSAFSYCLPMAAEVHNLAPVLLGFQLATRDIKRYRSFEEIGNRSYVASVSCPATGAHLEAELVYSCQTSTQRRNLGAFSGAVCLGPALPSEWTPVTDLRAANAKGKDSSREEDEALRLLAAASLAGDDEEGDEEDGDERKQPAPRPSFSAAKSQPKRSLLPQGWLRDTRVGASHEESFSDCTITCTDPRSPSLTPNELRRGTIARLVLFMYEKYHVIATSVNEETGESTQTLINGSMCPVGEVINVDTLAKWLDGPVTQREFYMQGIFFMIGKDVNPFVFHTPEQNRNWLTSAIRVHRINELSAAAERDEDADAPRRQSSAAHNTIRARRGEKKPSFVVNYSTSTGNAKLYNVTITGRTPEFHLRATLCSKYTDALAILTEYEDRKAIDGSKGSREQSLHQ